jgi:hypothetical protein
LSVLLAVNGQGGAGVAITIIQPLTSMQQDTETSVCARKYADAILIPALA